MENFFSRITERKNYLDLSEEEKREYADEYISETNLNFIDSIIDYYFLVRLPEYIEKSIKNSRQSSDLDDLTFKIEYKQKHAQFPIYGAFDEIRIYCEEFTCPFDKNPRNQGKIVFGTGCKSLFVDRKLFAKLMDETLNRTMLYNSLNRHEGSPALVVTPINGEEKAGVQIHGTAKQLANIYYLELQSYTRRHRVDNYDDKDLEKCAYQLRVKRSSSDDF